MVFNEVCVDWETVNGMLKRKIECIMFGITGRYRKKQKFNIGMSGKISSG